LSINQPEVQILAERLALVLDNRKKEADADDFSRLAWLAIHLGKEANAQNYVKKGLVLSHSCNVG
jgi:predicted membrane metal-binding protein